MAIMRVGGGLEGSLVVRGRGLWLRPLAIGDYAQWAELRALSRNHLTPWEPEWSRDELSRDAFRRRIRHHERECREDLGYAFAMFDEGADRLIGGVSLSNLRRGVTQSASLGYWVGLPHTRQGAMTEAVRAIVPFAFGALRLHRIEAATMPENKASIRVLERNGFAREGYARRYLKINGDWRDHILFARLVGDAAVGEEQGC